MYSQLYNEPKKLMILGAGCSFVSQATAQASHLWNLVQVRDAIFKFRPEDKRVKVSFLRVPFLEISFRTKGLRCPCL